MNKKRSVSITIFGIINIIVGLVVMKFLFGVFLALLFGFGEGRIPGFFGWLRIYLFNLPYLLIYIFAGPILLWSGIEILRRKPYSRKLIIISALVIIGSIIMDLLFSLYFYIIDMELWGDFGINFFIDYYGKGPLYLLLSFLIYAILLLIFFTRPKVKEMFSKKGYWNKKIFFKKKVVFVD